MISWLIWIIGACLLVCHCEDCKDNYNEYLKDMENDLPKDYLFRVKKWNDNEEMYERIKESLQQFNETNCDKSSCGAKYQAICCLMLCEEKSRLIRPGKNVPVFNSPILIKASRPPVTSPIISPIYLVSMNGMKHLIRSIFNAKHNDTIDYLEICPQGTTTELSSTPPKTSLSPSAATTSSTSTTTTSSTTSNRSNPETSSQKTLSTSIPAATTTPLTRSNTSNIENTVYFHTSSNNYTINKVKHQQHSSNNNIIHINNNHIINNIKQEQSRTIINSTQNLLVPFSSNNIIHINNNHIINNIKQEQSRNIITENTVYFHTSSNNYTINKVKHQQHSSNNNIIHINNNHIINNIKQEQSRNIITENTVYFHTSSNNYTINKVKHQQHRTIINSTQNLLVPFSSNNNIIHINNNHIINNIKQEQSR
ncbi:GATA zinc finger domain-containing protein 14 [Esox lucius]|uniref:GATA zinc finger domain-containing protein 14 n=1 Tax=Esox lucius TaxID=8010 RepID=UPI001476F843|nr:GATA zinc finger domain-containing protein 14 [Esox lucius]